MFFSRRSGHRFVDRVEEGGYDKLVADFTKDDNWHELDLSGIIPKNATWIFFTIIIGSADDTAEVYFREVGGTAGNYRGRQYVQVANKPIVLTSYIPITNAGKIEYRVSNVTWTYLHLTVRGWFI